MTLNDTFECTVESLAAGGDGVAHVEGQTVFLPGTVPGDRLRASLLKDHGRWAKAAVLEILEAGPGRIEAPCPVAGRCGACQWQHVSREEQRRARLGIVEDALRRIAGLESWPEIDYPDHEDTDLGYRCRAEYHGEVEGGGLAFGFFAPGSHEIVEHESCLLLASPLAEAMTDLRIHLKKNLTRPGRFQIEATLLDGPSLQILARVERRSSAELNKSLAAWSPAGLKAVHLELRLLDARAVLREAKGAPFLRERLNLELPGGGSVDLPLYTRPGEFVQSNAVANRRLVEAVLAGADLAPDDWVLDLYCGAGNLSLPLAAAGAKVLGVETRRGALRSARKTARELNLGRARFRSGRVDEVLPTLVEEGKHYRSVVLDPPRQGAPELKDYLDRLEVSRLLAVSCHPAALARDIVSWLSLGFRLESVKLFDFFAQTHHVEVLAILSR